jgi:hypothetical protein
MARATSLIKLIERRMGGGATLMYHGTSSSFLRKILKVGLVPDPQEKTWQDDPAAGFHRASRASFPGIYFSENMMNNTIRKFGGNLVIIAAQIQQRTALIDEDEIVDRIERSSGFGNEAVILQLYKAMYGDPSFDYKTFPEQVRNTYAKWLHNLFINIPVDERAIKPNVAMNLFKAIVSRKAAYLSGIFSSLSLYDLDIPDKRQAEQDYRTALDAFIRNIKQLAVNRGRDSFSHNVRVTEPVTYRGRNRILAVYEEVGNGRLKIHYGHPISDFEQQWSQRVGRFTWVK